MNPRARKLITALFVLLFILAGPGAVLYAYGWRFDTHQLRFLKVGGIFLSGIPSDARILVDASEDHQREQLLTGSFIGNLLPATYKVEVNKTGFHRWEKNIEVTPSGVSSFPNIVLVPEKPEETMVLEKPMLDFWVNDSRLIYKDVRGSYFLTDPDNLDDQTNLGIIFNNLKQKVLEYPGYVPITRVTATEDPDRWVVHTASTRYLLDVEDSTIALFKGMLPPQPLLPDNAGIPNPESVRYVSAFSDNAHHLVQYPDDVYLLELGSHDPLNMPLVARGVKKHVYQDGRLYLLRSSGISYTEL